MDGSQQSRTTRSYCFTPRTPHKHVALSHSVSQYEARVAFMKLWQLAGENLSPTQLKIK